MSENVTTLTDLDGDELHVTGPYPAEDSAVLTVHGPRRFLRYDREGAVALIEALTAAVEAHDTREAAEASKLKRGDVVRQRIDLHGLGRGVYTVISDENAEGRVDLVRVVGPSGYMPAGKIIENEPAAPYERSPA